MYVRASFSFLACRDGKKYKKKFKKKLTFLLILFFRVFMLLGLFMLCSHAAKFSSLSTSVLLSYI